MIKVSDVVPGKYKMTKREFNRSETYHKCKIVKEYPHFFTCIIDGKQDTITKAKMLCGVIKLKKNGD